MKLSDLVAYRNNLQKFSTDETMKIVELGLGNFIHLVESNSVKLPIHLERLESNFNTVQQYLGNFQLSVDDLKADLQRMIESAERPWFQESYRLYDTEMRNDTVEYILNRRPCPSLDELDHMHARLRYYVDWRLPGLIIRPGLENFIDNMVSFDPLYLVDTSYDLLEPTIQKYPEEYQRRLRPYVIHEEHNKSILELIPNTQFGLCFAYNFFEYRPFEIFRCYLEEIFLKLKPGGIFILTFNDCDNEKAVDLVERHFKCYTPGNLIKELAKNIGYQVIYEWNNDGPSTWLELRKPGILTSNRGGQTLARVRSLSSRVDTTKISRNEAKRAKREAKSRKN